MRIEGRKASRSYRPKVEALEALRLLDAGLAPSLAPMLVDQLGPDAASAGEDAGLCVSEAAWDAALQETRLADLLGPARLADEQALQNGLHQLERYLGRAWSRAGIAAQQHDDCTQAVYLALLEQFGREGFDLLTTDVGRSGIRNVLSRETPDGPDFFRAVDMIKKRCQRERTFQSLDDHYARLTESAGTDGTTSDWRGALNEAIDRSLNPREAELVRATLEGRTPSEIAQDWGCAAKTVSNEKTRVLQKLRETLLADLQDN